MDRDSCIPTTVTVVTVTVVILLGVIALKAIALAVVVGVVDSGGVRRSGVSLVPPPPLLAVAREEGCHQHVSNCRLSLCCQRRC